MRELSIIPTRYAPPGLLTRWAIRILALIALGVSVFLFYEEMAGGAAAVPGCGPESGCSAVLTSPWARWYGIPVAAPGIVIYAIILAASLHIGPSKPPSPREGLGEGVMDRQERPNNLRRRAAWIILLLTSLIAAGAAIWFIVVQAVLLHALCKYCDTVHACGLILTAIVFYTAPIGRRRLTPDEPADPMMISPTLAGSLLAIACLMVAGFVAVQWIAPSSTAAVQRFVTSTGERSSDVPLDTGPGPHRVISLPLRGGGRVRLSPHDYPVLGSADAPVVLVELFDYTCPHCRKLHEQLEQARKRYGSQLAIIVLPTPLDAHCNFLYKQTDPIHRGACELAKLALAVWKASTPPLSESGGGASEGAGKAAINKFETFHNWLFAPAAPRSVKAARAEAVRLVGAQALKQAMADPWIDQQINHDVNLYAINGGSLPQLITPQALIRGRPQTATELFKLLESVTPLKKG